MAEHGHAAHPAHAERTDAGHKAPDGGKKEASIFVTLIAAIALAFSALWYFKLLTATAVLLVIFAILIFIYSRSSHFMLEIQEYERAVVFRWGKFLKVVGPGWVVLRPFSDTYRMVDLRVKTIDVTPQEVVTKDDVKLTIDAILFIKVSDPVKAVLNVEDYEDSAVSYVKANLRDIVGKMELDEVISGIDEVNRREHAGLAQVSKDWGVDVVQVEIQSIQLPEELLAAMHEKKAAVEKKHAAVQRAEAQKLTIDAIQSAAGKLTDPALRYLYIQALEKVAEGKSNKIIFPMELSRLAESLTKSLGGVPYEKAQEEVISKYREAVADEAERGTEGVIATLRKELEEKETRKRPAAPAKKRKFEFG